MAGTLDFTLDLHSQGFLRKMARVSTSVLGFLGLAGGVTAVGFALKNAVHAGVAFNATIETQTTAFQTLLGSTAAAQQRINELIKFSAQTPFQLDEVLRASKVLQALTAGALAGRDGMTLVGDAAAAAGRDFQETAMWIGRLYGGLKSGTPVGEATMRLLEMGLISGETKRQLDQLSTSGGAVNKVMQIMNDTFSGTSGAMVRQSQTFLGLWSTFKDNITQALGGALRPLFGSLKEILASLVEYDWVELGERIGGALSLVINVFKEGQFWDLLHQGFAAVFEFAKTGFEAVAFYWEGVMAEHVYSGVLRGLAQLPGPVLKAIGLSSMPVTASPKHLREMFDAQGDRMLIKAFNDWESSPLKALVARLISPSGTGGFASPPGPGAGAGAAYGAGKPVEGTMLEKLGFITGGGGVFNTQERTARASEKTNEWLERVHDRLNQYLGARSDFINI